LGGSGTAPGQAADLKRDGVVTMRAALGHGPRLLAALVLAAVGLSGPLAQPALADLPAGVQIGSSAECTMRQAGNSGFRIDPKFTWYYSDDASLGPAVTISGTYTLQTHNPANDQWETLYTYPYGFELQPGSTENRGKRLASPDPHVIFDQVKLETTWQIDILGQAGSESSTTACTIEPPPPGMDPVTAVAAPPAKSDNEVFVDQEDPSPIKQVSMSSSLYCNLKERGKITVTWGLITSNDGVGGGDGVLVSGVLRASTRPKGGDYGVVQEQPFALWMLNRETTAVDGYVDTTNLSAAKLEVEWRVNVGTAVDPGAPVQHILRTTACS
jgi:hypothetical protein